MLEVVEFLAVSAWCNIAGLIYRTVRLLALFLVLWIFLSTSEHVRIVGPHHFCPWRMSIQLSCQRVLNWAGVPLALHVVQYFGSELLLALGEPAHSPVFVNRFEHMSALTASVVLARGTTGIHLQFSVQHVLSWVVRCWISVSRFSVPVQVCLHSGPRLPTVLVNLEPEGRLMIKAVLLMRSQRKSTESTSRTAPAALSTRHHLLSVFCVRLQCGLYANEECVHLAFRRLKYSQQDSQRLSCYPCGLDLAGHCSCIAVELSPDPPLGFQVTRPVASLQSLGYVEGIVFLTASQSVPHWSLGSRFIICGLDALTPHLVLTALTGAPLDPVGSRQWSRQVCSVA